MSTRQHLLDSFKRECQQTNQPLIVRLIEHYFQTESPNVLLVIKQICETEKDQPKVRYI